MKKDKKITREFRPTTFALKNRSTIFLLSFVLAVFGIISYRMMSVELFPEVKFAYVFVNTIYPGNPPVDIENLITRPLEKEINSINGIKVMRSVSAQDSSNIFVEFNPSVEIKAALQDVKDAVDKARSELPDDLMTDPFVMDIDMNEFPIININLSGDYSINELKQYAEYLEDAIEDIPEISKVEIRGLNEREIQINVDPFKLQSRKLGFYDIESAVTAENVSISGGSLKIDDTLRSIRTVGEFTSIKEIENIIIKHEQDHIVYLRDVAEVVDGFEDPQTLARLDRQPVVSVQVIKKSGENLLNASKAIFQVLDQGRRDKALPGNLNISITNDQSDIVRKMINNLENNILLAMICVILVLFFFLGARNAVFVGMSIPMSMFISFVVLGLIGSTINMMVLFALVLSLGMLVDNAIVVVENIYRFLQQGYSLFESCRQAVGEIALPIIVSTATTLAAFIPLAFWPGLMGEFMKFLPITLIVVLTSSLISALIIIPVYVRRFIKREAGSHPPDRSKSFKISLTALLGGVVFFILRLNPLAVISLAVSLVVLLNVTFLYRASRWFQFTFLDRLEHWYLKLIRFSLRGKRPGAILLLTVVVFILTMMFFGMRNPKVELFPPNEPDYINVMADLPIGSDITATDEVMTAIENDLYRILERYPDIVKSILTTIGNGVQGENDMFGGTGNTPYRGMTTITFIDYEERNGISTADIKGEISRKLTHRYPGVTVTVSKNTVGPPTGRAISLEIIGRNFDTLVPLAEDVRQYLEEEDIPGIEGLKLDLDTGKPELLVHIDRDSARRFGLSTAQIASTIRTALFGREVSDFKEGEDKYTIWLRLQKEYRHDITSLLNQKITFRSQSSGRVMQVPISAVATFSNSTTYSSVRRKDMDRVITIYSNVIEGFNATEINNKLKLLMKDYELPKGFLYRFTGEQEEMADTMGFLIRALMICLSLILLILVTQFNSLLKPAMIMASVLFSTIGVFGGMAIFKMNFIIIMTGVGLISLAGVVVNNAIVLIDYIDFLKLNRRAELGLKDNQALDIRDATECIVQGGRTRLRPVLLTAVTTILGLVPMAIGINLNFSTLLSDLDPQIYFGGFNALFWGPMAWTVIFGLSFATFLTLILVPVMYLITNRRLVKLNLRMNPDK